MPSEGLSPMAAVVIQLPNQVALFKLAYNMESSLKSYWIELFGKCALTNTGKIVKFASGFQSKLALQSDFVLCVNFQFTSKRELLSIHKRKQQG